MQILSEILLNETLRCEKQVYKMLGHKIKDILRYHVLKIAQKRGIFGLFSAIMG